MIASLCGSTLPSRYRPLSVRSRRPCRAATELAARDRRRRLCLLGSRWAQGEARGYSSRFLTADEVASSPHGALWTPCGLVSAYSRCVRSGWTYAIARASRACDLPQQPFGLSRGYFRTDAFDRPTRPARKGESAVKTWPTIAQQGAAVGRTRCRALTRSPNNLSWAAMMTNRRQLAPTRRGSSQAARPWLGSAGEASRTCWRSCRRPLSSLSRSRSPSPGAQARAAGASAATPSLVAQTSQSSPTSSSREKPNHLRFGMHRGHRFRRYSRSDLGVYTWPVGTAPQHHVCAFGYGPSRARSPPRE